MKIAIMQPYFFPYIGYFQLIKSVDVFVVYDDVAFIKQGWINRNNILLNNQKYLFLVPVKNISSFKKINETEIDYKLNWKKKMLLTFEQAYKKAPYYQSVFPIIQNVLNSQKTSIAELAFESMYQICNYLGINTKFLMSGNSFHNNHLKGKDRVIDICIQQKASQYINPIGGQELYMKQDFLEKNLQLNFIKTTSHEYKQFNNEFIPYLSIIDVLMFNSKEEVDILLRQFELL